MPTNNKPAATSQPVVEEQKAEATALELSLAERKRQEMKSTSSDLRNQVTTQDVVDFQLLSNTPAQMIAAMTGWTIDQLAARAKELETTLKGSVAGSLSEKANLI